MSYALYGMGLIAAGGMGYTFAKIATGLLGRSMNPPLRIAFIMSLIIFAFGYGAGLALYLHNDDLRWLDIMKSAMNITVLVVMLASIIWLLVQRGMILEKDRRKGGAAFVLLYLVFVIAISAPVSPPLVQMVFPEVLWRSTSQHFSGNLGGEND